MLACVLALGAASKLAGIAQEPAEWRTAYLTQSAVLDIVTADGGGVWAVGEAGTILYFDGESWQRLDSPTDETLHAVAFGSADDGWAVGKAGTILRYEGTTWHSASAPTTSADELFDAVIVDASGWAVGRRFNTVSETFEGLILRLSDGTWTEVSIPRTESLYACAFASTTDGWAVGKAGTVLRWDGVEWTKQNSPTNVDLHDVTIVGDDVWAVGDGGILVRWNQKGWQVLPTSHPALRSVGFDNADAGWAVGTEGTILHYNGTAWSPISVPLSMDLFGLYIDATGNPWVTGERGLVGRVTSDGWQLLAQPYVDVDLTAIDLVNATAGWAIGGQPFQPTEGMTFWQHTGFLWNPRQIHEAPPLFDIAVLSEEEAWAVGQDLRVEVPTEAGVIWHYTAGAWTTAGYPGVSALFAVEAISSDDVWAAGQDGALVHYNGTDWQRTPIPENVHFYGLHFRAPNDGWAVGERFDLVSEPPRYLAVAYHYDGSEWQPTAVPNAAWEATTDSTRRPRLLAIHVFSGTDVWAVGNAGAILHYDGERWTVVQGRQDYSLLDVDFAGPGDGWAVGTQGTILRYDGHTWSPTDSATTGTLRLAQDGAQDIALNGVVSRPWGEAWAVGSQGAFLYHPPAVPWYMYLPLTGR